MYPLNFTTYALFPYLQKFTVYCCHSKFLSKEYNLGIFTLKKRQKDFKYLDGWEAMVENIVSIYIFWQ